MPNPNLSTADVNRIAKVGSYFFYSEYQKIKSDPKKFYLNKEDLAGIGERATRLVLKNLDKTVEDVVPTKEVKKAVSKKASPKKTAKKKSAKKNNKKTAEKSAESES